MNIEKLTNYRLIEKTQLEDINSIGYILEHKKTKARVISIENDDDNKVFYIGFRTPPKDSTGVAHIIEHTVLCGSKKFPVKDPFIELAKGSLNTFLNAMTYPDKTVYPVASCNAKDFQNLMHVYLDAVFYPNIYKEEKIFKQEGWHYELENVDDQITYNGVVYNEMKGVFSSSDQIMERAIQKSLFPDVSYGVESGGDPEAIPDLTYEDYLDFHRKYYHPSNSYIYLYGDVDMEEKLDWIDKEYLSKFDYQAIDSAVKTQKAFDSMRRETAYYSVTDNEDTSDKAILSYNAVCDTSLNRELYQSLQVLNHVLITGIGAPIKQTLLDAGFGTEIDSIFENGIKQPFFSIVSKNISAKKKDEFVALVKKSLEKLVDEGLNKRSIKAAINAMEFQYREADFGVYPKGLMYGLQIFDSWLYDDTKPFIHIQASDMFEFMKKNIDTGYFEGLIKKYLLDNTHTSLVCVEPSIGLTKKMEDAVADKLKQYKESLTEDELSTLIKETKELKKYQEEPTSPEDLLCIPLLERADIDKNARTTKTDKINVKGVETLHHDYFTNGVSYVRILFDITDLMDEYTPYISMLTDTYSAVDTDKHSKLELSNEILLHAGSLSVDVTCVERDDDAKFYFEIYTKVLYDEISEVFGLINEIISSSHLEDEKRLKEIIAEARSKKSEGMLAGGHVYSALRSGSYFSEARQVVDGLIGISYYDFLCDLDDNFEERKENLFDVFNYLTKTVFTKERLTISVTSTKDGIKKYEGAIDNLMPCVMDESNEVKKVKVYWDESKKAHGCNEGFETASKVQYVSRSGSFKEAGFEYSGVYSVVKTILSYDYLWNEIRVKGGAYGAMCSFDMHGYVKFMSYRDPNLENTNEVYEGIADYLESFNADERDMMKYIIGTISTIDTPLTPSAKGRRSLQHYLMGLKDESVQKKRDEILQANVEDIKAVSKVVRAIMAQNHICVIGSQEKIKNCESLFDEKRVLK